MGSGLSGSFKHSNVNEPQTIAYHFTLVGAADVAASGYTLTGRGVTSATRTAEGKVQVIFDNTHNAFENVCVITNSDDLTCIVDAVDPDASGGASLTLQFRSSGGSPADIDPDSATIYCTAWFKATSI